MGDFDLSQLTGSLTAKFGDVIPGILSAVLLLIVGWFIAGILKRVTYKVLRSTGVDAKLSGSGSSFNISRTVSKLVYYLVLTLVLLAVLNMMGVSDALAPLQNMVDQITGFIPNIFAGGIIGFVGYVLANIAKEAVGLVSGSIEHYTDKYGISKDLNITSILKSLVFVFVFVPILLVALDTLQMKMISEPASKMLGGLMEAIPNILAAGIIMLVFFIVGKFVVGIVTGLISSMDVDKYANSMGLSGLTGGMSIPDLVGKVLFFFIMFFGLVTAIEKLNFNGLSDVLQNMLSLSGSIMFGMIVLLIGNKVSGLVADYFAKSGAGAMSSIARFATLGLFLAISLKYMGIADDIVNLAFGLTLGAVAVAFALSFGLGGREAAGEQMKKFLNKF